MSAKVTIQWAAVVLTILNNASMWMPTALISLKVIVKGFMLVQRTSTSTVVRYLETLRTQLWRAWQAITLQWHLYMSIQVLVRMTNIQIWLSSCLQAPWTGQSISGIRTIRNLYLPLKARKSTSTMFNGVQLILACLLHAMQKATSMFGTSTATKKHQWFASRYPISQDRLTAWSGARTEDVSQLAIQWVSSPCYKSIKT